jgi:hypothetical protein
MRLFCFACRNIDNILKGYAARKWAVASTSDRDQQRRRTNARRNVAVGDLGVLYCNPLHAFTVPFRFASIPDFNRVETAVWPEPWILPFDIEPLGPPHKYITAAEARERWSVVKRGFSRMKTEQGGISAAMLLTGTTVFVPHQIDHTDWLEILTDIGGS